MVKFNGFLTL